MTAGGAATQMLQGLFACEVWLGIRAHDWLPARAVVMGRVAGFKPAAPALQGGIRGDIAHTRDWRAPRQAARPARQFLIPPVAATGLRPSSAIERILSRQLHLSDAMDFRLSASARRTSEDGELFRKRGGHLEGIWCECLSWRRLGDYLRN